jgi:iron complex outermembrane receptor protein
MKQLSKIWCYLLVLNFCLVLGTIVAPRVIAQNMGESLAGTVMDPVGSAVPGAVVVARNETSGVETRATTNQEGKFSIPNLAAGTYTVEVSAPGFALTIRRGLDARAQNLNIPLSLGSVSDAITVEANTSGSIAAQNAPMDGLLEAASARTEVSPIFIQNFTSPEADFGELVEMAPGTFSISSNGIGLGQDKTYFRGFPDGDYDIDFDGVPFYDTNTPSHHTWAFFPDPWVGSVDFDRSPGDAATLGPTPFGGSIHLLSPDMAPAPILNGSISYGSWNTFLADVNFDSGPFAGKKSNLFVDVQHMQSDGFQTFNYQVRNAGSLKYVYKFSDNNVLTGFSGVVWLDSNTPNNNPTRAQLAQFGNQYLLTNDTNAGELGSNGTCTNTSLTACQYPLNYKFYTYHVPTDFEYVDWSKQWGHGWKTDFKPYTLSYYNAQYYNNSLTTLNATSAVDKLNSYRKYGETFVASQVSKYGILRVGLWYEWATTNRYQTPSDPLTLVDTVLPNFHESFYTNSYQPFAEYEFHATQRLTLTAGFKFSYFNQNLTQYQDNGKTVGCLGGTLVGGTTGVCQGGVPFVNHSAGYNSYLPSADANYHIMNNWSIYGQFGKGTIVPPSGAFDTANGSPLTLPKPTGVTTYQGGTVWKMKQVTINADYFWTKFQNTFASIPDPNNSSAIDWVSNGDAVTKGFEGEANFYVTHGFSFYVNGTVGTALYVSDGLPSKGLWVANAPANTEAFGLTYQSKHFDFGFFDKRVGPMWNDNNAAKSGTPAAFPVGTGGVYHQVIPINPFSVTNVYFNYVLRNGSRFDQTKFRLTINNLLNNQNIVGDAQSQTGPAYVQGPNDQLLLLPGRSITLTITPSFGWGAR